VLCFTTDLGPNFYAWSGVIKGETVLMLSPQVRSNPAARRAALALLQRRGLEHSADTHNCPLSSGK
jgi:hypothetical protein